jgi:hypothetical protein
MIYLQPTKTVYDENELTKFTLDHLQGIFYIYIIAVSTTIVIFFIELIFVYIKAMFF